MTRHRIYTAPPAGAAAFLLCLLLACSAAGQEDLPRDRFVFGGRLSVSGSALITQGNMIRATSTPPWKMTRTSDWTSGRFGGGFTFQYNLLERLGIATEVIYRKAGYKAEQVVVTGVDKASTSVNEQKTTTTTETTRGDYWEVPVLARIYFGRRPRADFHRFFNAGMTVRRVTDIRTSTEVSVSPDDTSTYNEVPVTPAHRRAFGLVAGGGIQIMDDFGLKLTPEIRFTHWLENVFDSPPARSNRNQVEFIFGITF